VRYERPRIVSRQRIDAMLTPAISVPSDRNLKENVLLVAW